DDRFLIEGRYGGVFNPGTPIIRGFPKKVFNSALQRCFKRLAIGKGKVLGSAQNKGFLAEKMAYRDIRRQPHLLDTVIEVYMVAPPEFREYLRPVCTYRLADDPHARPTG